MHTELVKYLLPFGYPSSWQRKDAVDFSLLHFAVRNHDSETLRLLLKEKFDVNFVDSKRRTPLHEAAICGNVDAAKILLEYGAVKGVVDFKNMSPYDCANGIENGSIREQLLIELTERVPD